MCGTGVASLISVTLIPVAEIARTADSLPEPGPVTITEQLFIPQSIALRAASSAATCAANGVLRRDPLKPLLPALDQVITSPFASANVTIVLLKLAEIVAIPVGTLRLTRFRSYFFLFATVFFGPLRVRAFVFVLCPRAGKPLR